MSSQKLVTRGNYVLFLRELLISMLKNNLIRLTLIILLISTLLAAFTSISYCTSCSMNYLFSSVYLTISLPLSFMIHELIHFVVLDSNVKVTFSTGLVKMEPVSHVSTRKALGSALAGPLASFFIGLLMYYADSIKHLNLFGLYFPFLIHILILPYDILGALGFEIG
ncbi:MAG: hypothetical protein ACUVQ0_03235 [Thermoproteota archaeon]